MHQRTSQSLQTGVEQLRHKVDAKLSAAALKEFNMVRRWLTGRPTVWGEAQDPLEFLLGWPNVVSAGRSSTLLDDLSEQEETPSSGLAWSYWITEAATQTFVLHLHCLDDVLPRGDDSVHLDRIARRWNELRILSGADKLSDRYVLS